MKKRTLIILLSVFLVLSCSKQEDGIIAIENETELVEKDKLTEVENLNETDEVEKQNGILVSPIAELLGKEGGKQALLNSFYSNKTGKDKTSQLAFIQHGADPVPCTITDGKYLACAYEIVDGFYQSPIDVRILPNNEAHFIARSSNFAVEVYEMPNFDLIYSNLCMDEFEGFLFIYARGTYELIDDPFYGYQYYVLTGPLPEDSSENESGPSRDNVLVMTAKVTDGVRNLNIDELTYDCEMPTSVKHIRIRSIIRSTGEEEFSLTGI